MAVDLQQIVGPAAHVMRVVRGDSYMRIFTVKDNLTKTPVPLNGLTGKAQVRVTVDDPKVVAELTVVVDQTTTGATVGQVTVTATATQTRFYPETGVWDLQLTDGTEDFLKTIVNGQVKVVRDITI